MVHMWATCVFFPPFLLIGGKIEVEETVSSINSTVGSFLHLFSLKKNETPTKLLLYLFVWLGLARPCTLQLYITWLRK